MADGSIILDTKVDDSGAKKGISGLENIAKTGLKGVAVGAGVVASAFAGIVSASVSARGELEQQVGGIETLFKDSADEVIKNANNAYKTAGLSATEYMQNVTSFSASLLQSTAGDTKKAAQIADTAMIDMADNANKMGTSMEAIQNAYQGFAKQNYTMLDNLKLGYGGTQTEMERLLKDAEKVTGIKYDIKNLSDVYNAIHVIQGELGITETTYKEATGTLQGSMAQLKASWGNFLSGSGNLNQVTDAVVNVAKNILRIIDEAVPEIMTGISEALPELLTSGQEILNKLIEGLLAQLPSLMNTAITIINQLAQGLIQMLPEIIQVGIQVISQLIVGIAKTIPTLIPQAVDCIITIVEGLLDNIDMIIEAGIELILGLIDGIIEATPRLIEKIPEIIQKLFEAFVRNFPKIIEAGGKLIGKLIVGIVGALGTLLSKAGDIISTIVRGIQNGWNAMKNAGANLIKGIWEGISGSISWIKDKISGWVGNVTNFIKNLFGIHSPSTLFRDEIGQYLGFGIGEGFEKSLPGVYKDMKKEVDFETEKLSANLTTSPIIQVQKSANVQATLESIDENKHITVNTVTNLDSKVIARETNKVNTRQKLQYGIA